jgi:hypothetical protein
MSAADASQPGGTAERKPVRDLIDLSKAPSAMEQLAESWRRK